MEKSLYGGKKRFAVGEEVGVTMPGINGVITLDNWMNVTFLG
jgi:hypothetical protein